MAASGSGDDVVIIKKYANRRLYDTESSSYITLERLAEMVRQKREFKVVDAQERRGHHPQRPHPDHHGRGERAARPCFRSTSSGS